MEAYMAYDTDKSTRSSAPGFGPGAFGEMGKKQFEAAVEMQKEFLDTMEEINRAWLTRAQSEVTLASELVGKLATSRSIPDAATAYQECMSRQMEMLAEDSRRMLADGEKLMRAGARLLSNGSPGLST
jgi:Phasin protein